METKGKNMKGLHFCALGKLLLTMHTKPIENLIIENRRKNLVTEYITRFFLTIPKQIPH